MNIIPPIVQILGFLLILLSFLMTLPVNLLVFGDTPDWLAFVKSSVVCFSIGAAALALAGGRQKHALRQQQMFMLTVSAWVVIPLFSSLPLLLSDMKLSMTDAFFESISGVTTTGSTVLTGLDHLPDDILLWRSIMQWMGGIGIIGMAVASCRFSGLAVCGCLRPNRPNGTRKRCPPAPATWPAAWYSSIWA